MARKTEGWAGCDQGMAQLATILSGIPLTFVRSPGVVHGPFAMRSSRLHCPQQAIELIAADRLAACAATSARCSARWQGRRLIDGRAWQHSDV